MVVSMNANVRGTYSEPVASRGSASDDTANGTKTNGQSH
jgi:hypothetical protein